MKLFYDAIKWIDRIKIMSYIMLYKNNVHKACIIVIIVYIYIYYKWYFKK